MPPPSQTHCQRFDYNDPIPIIRSYSFSVPVAGNAEGTFHGSLTCSHNSTTLKTVQLTTQITTVNINPRYFGPGGMLYSARFIGTDTFNLASTRVISYSTAGTKTVYFKIARVSMNSGLTCSVYTANFSVVFI